MIEYSQNFLKEAKELSKKFKNLKNDIKELIEDIENSHDLGVYLGSNLYKKRVRNSSIPTCKSGGFRVIIFTKFEEKIILLCIYSKTNQDTIGDDELIGLINELSNDS